MTEEKPEITLTRNQRYYALHREETLNKVKERYKASPEYIAKQEEIKRKRTERDAHKEATKQAEKDAKRIEKERIRQERITQILASKKK